MMMNHMSLVPIFGITYEVTIRGEVSRTSDGESRTSMMGIPSGVMVGLTLFASLQSHTLTQ